MTPDDPRWKKKRPDINEPVPLPQRYEAMTQLPQPKFPDYQPIKKRRGLKFVRPSGNGSFNQGRIG